MCKGFTNQWNQTRIFFDNFSFCVGVGNMSESKEIPSQLTIEQQLEIIDSWRNPHFTETERVQEDLDLLIEIKKQKHQEIVEKYIDFTKADPLLAHFALNVTTITLNELITGKLEKEIFQKNFDKLSLGIKLFVKEIYDHRIACENELLEFSKKEFPYIQKFPNLLKGVIEYEMNRLTEFQEVSSFILSKIKQVQLGEIAMKTCSDDILQKDLANRFFKK